MLTISMMTTALAGPWALAPFEDETAPASFEPVDERVGSPTFGMIVLPTDPARAQAVVVQWKQDVWFQHRFPLLAVYADERLPPLHPGLTIHALPPGEFAWIDRGAGALLTCSALACVPTAVTGKLPLRLGRSTRKRVAEAIDAPVARGRDAVVRTFEQAQRAVREPEVVQALSDELPRKARAAMEELAPERRAEALAVVLHESRAPHLRRGLQLAFDHTVQFDLACTTLDVEACLELARDKEAWLLRRTELDEQLGREPRDHPPMPSEVGGSPDPSVERQFGQSLQLLQHIELAYDRGCRATGGQVCEDRDRLSAWTTQLQDELEAYSAGRMLTDEERAARAARAELLAPVVVGSLPDDLPQVAFSTLSPKGELQSPTFPSSFEGSLSRDEAECTTDLAVTPDGTVSAVRVSECGEAFANAVHRVAQSWRFDRTDRDGIVATQMKVGFQR